MNKKVKNADHVNKLIDFYESIESDAVKKDQFLRNIFVQLVKQESNSAAVGTMGLVSGKANRETWTFSTEERIEDGVLKELQIYDYQFFDVDGHKQCIFDIRDT